MKKFMIFLLMAFLYIGTCQARSESSHPNDAQRKLLSWVSPTPDQSFMTRYVKDAADPVFLTANPEGIVAPGDEVTLTLNASGAAISAILAFSASSTLEAAVAASTVTWEVNGTLHSPLVVPDAANKLLGKFSTTDVGTYRVKAIIEVPSTHGTTLTFETGIYEIVVAAGGGTTPSAALYANILGNTQVCENDQVTLSALVTGDASTVTHIVWLYKENPVAQGPIFNFVPSTLFTDPADHKITLEIAYGAACIKARDSVEIEYLPAAPDIHVEFVADTVCVGGQVTAKIQATDATTGTAITLDLNNPIYSWFVNGVEVPGEHMGVITLNMPMAGTYGFAAQINTPMCGISAQTDADTVYVFDALPLTITGDNVVCQNDTAKLTATNITGASYTWAGPDPAAASITGNKLATTIPGVYAVTATMESGCFATAEFTVYQFGGDLQVTADQMNVCPGTPVILNANLDGWFNENISYAWSNGLGNSSTVSTTVDATTTYKVTASAQSQGATENNSLACQLVDSITVNVLPHDTVKTIFASSGSSSYNNGSLHLACVGQQSYFTVSSQPAGDYAYTWYVDGVEVPGENLSAINLTFNEPAAHTVKAKAVVTGCDVATLSEEETIWVSDLPEVTISGNNVICNGNTAELTAHATNNFYNPSGEVGLAIVLAFFAGTQEYNYSYLWSDGTAVADLNTTEAGVYTVTVTNNTTQCHTTASIEVTTFGGDLQVTASEMNVCPGTPVTLNANLDGWSNENVSYEWSDGLGTSSTVSATVGATHTYYVTASAHPVTDASGTTTAACQLTSSIEISATANDTLTTNVEVVAEPNCVGDMAELKATTTATSGAPASSYTYTWYKNGIEIPGENEATISVALNHAGTYTFAAKAVVGECNTSEIGTTAQVSVMAAPSVYITGTQQVINNATVAELTATVQPEPNSTTGISHDGGFTYDYEYAWSTGETGHTITVNHDGVYNVSVTNANGCVAVSAPFQVTSVANVNPIIAPSETEVCSHSNLMLHVDLGSTAYNPATQQIRWMAHGQYIDGQTGPTFDMPAQELYDIIKVTDFDICAELTEADGCVAHLGCVHKIITGRVIPHHIIVLNNGEEAQNICEGAQLDLTVYVQENEDDEPFEDDSLHYVWTRNGFVIPGVHGSHFSEQAWIYDSDPVTYVYTAYIDFGNGCYSDPVASTEVYVRRNPIVTIDGNPNVCYEGLNVNNVVLVAWVDGANDTSATYKWYESGQFRPNTSGSANYYVDYWQPTYDNPYIFTVEVTNGNGCSTISDPFYVNVYDKPVVNITGEDTIVCRDGGVTLQANLNNYHDPMLIFQWYKNAETQNPENIIDGATHEIETFYPTETTDYIVVVTHLMDYGRPNCVGTDTQRVYVFPGGIPEVTVHDDLDGAKEICEGRSIMFNAHVNGLNFDEFELNPEAVYTWYRNGELVENVHDSLYVDAPLAVDGYPTTYIYSVIVNQGYSGCESELTYFDTITVYPNPNIQLVTDPIICVSEPGVDNITLTANVDDVPTGVQYRWLEDNVQFLVTDTNAISLHKDYSENPYNFSVQIINDYGCTAQSDATVYVNEAPVVHITATDTMVCEGGVITLAASLNDWNSDALNYQWYDGDAQIDGATTLTYTVTPSAGMVHNYHIGINQTTSGCEATSTPIEVNVVARPVIATVAEVGMSADRNVCDGFQVNLTAEVQGGIAGGEVFTWYRNGVEIEGATQANLTEVVSALNGETTTYEYTVSVAQAISGCVSDIYDDLAAIIVNPNPTLELVTDPIVCNNEGQNITLTANVNPVIDGATFRWLEDNALMDPATYTANGNSISLHKDYRDYPYSFAVELVNEHGCSAVGEALVYVNAAPVVNITASDVVLCEGGTTTLTASLNDWNADELVYVWMDGTEEIPGATTLTYVATPTAGPHNYHIRITQQTSGCVAESNEIAVTVNPIPVIASVGLSQMNVCYGGQVAITAIPADGNVEGEVYTWYRNGILMEGATAATIYDTPEIIDNNTQQYTYTAVLTRPQPGCTSMPVTSPVVTVYPNPVVVITGDQHVCETDSVFLIANVDTTGMNVGGLHYTWYESGQIRDNMAYNLGDNNFFAEYMYARTEPYRFTVDVWRDNVGAGCVSHSEEYLVYVYPQPVVNITASETEICENGQVTLTANLNDNNATDLIYQWYTVGEEIHQIAVDYDGEGGYIYADDTVTVRYNIPGATAATYTTTLTETTTIGVMILQTPSTCWTNDEVIITVNPIPVVTAVTVAPEVVCDGAQVTVTAAIDANGTEGEPVFTWYRNGVLIEGADQATLQENVYTNDNHVTVNTYNAIVTLPASGCVSTLSVNPGAVTINPAPSTVTISGVNVLCENSTTTLTAYSDVDGIFVWNTGDTATSIVVPAGSYTVTMITPEGCEMTSENFNVEAFGTDLLVSASETAICRGEHTTLYVDQDGWQGNVTYAWDAQAGNSTASTVDVQPDSTTTYHVVATVSSTNGTCTAEGEVTIIVNQLPAEFAVTASTNVICEGQQISFTAPADPQVTSYIWYQNGVEIPGENQNVITINFNEAGIYTFAAKAISVDGCVSAEASAPVAVTVNPAPSQVTITGINVLCENSTTTLTAQSDVEGIFVWSTGDTATTVTVPAGSYNVTMITAEGCQLTSENFNVEAFGTDLLVSASATSICQGEHTTLYVDQDGWQGNVTYQWDAQADNSTASTVDVQPMATTTYHVTATVSSTNGTCTAEGEVTIVVNPLPVISDVTASATTICEGDQVTFTATGDANTTAYIWYANGVEIPGENQAVLTVNFNEAGIYNYAVKAISNENCLAAVAVAAPAVTVNPAPTTVTITGNNVLCMTDSTVLTAHSDVPGVFTWNDGTVGPNLTVAAGVYNVTITTAEGCHLTSENFTVESFGTDMIVSATATSICQGEHTTLSVDQNGWQGNVSYQWDAQAGNSIATTVDVQPDVTTTYHVTATVVNENGTCTAEGEVTIIVHPLPAQVVVNATTATTICQGDQVSFHATGDATTTAYIWYQNGVEIPGENQADLTVNFNEYGSYNFSAKAISNEGCISALASAPVTVTVTPAPTTVTITGNNVLCMTDSTVLTAHSDVPGVFTWNDGTVGPNITVAAGVYNVTITTAEGCHLTSENFTVESFGTDMIVSATATAICQGEHTTLSVDQNGWQGNVTYQWDAQAGNSTATTVDVQPDVTTTYHVTATVVNENGTCSTEGEVTIIVNPLPVVAAVTATETVVCEGTQVTFTATGDANTTAYIWYNNGVEIPGENQASLTVNFNEAGVYNYAVKAISNEGCVSAIAFNAPVVTVNAAPESVTITGNTVICDGGFTTLYANVVPNEPATYAWYKDNTLLLGAMGDNLVVTTAGSYKVVASFNGCSTESDAVVVTVEQAPQLQLTAEETLFCAGGSTVITAEATGWNNGDVIYNWSNNYQGSVYTFNAAVAGTYTFYVTASQATSGCVAVDSITINVNELPATPQIALDNAVICDGGQVTLTVTNAVADAVYTWYRNGVIIPGATTSVLSESPVTVDGDATNYVYTVVATLPMSGCTSLVSANTIVTVIPTPVVAVSVEGNTTLCVGGSTTLHANVSPANATYNYQWYKDNVLIPGAITADYTASEIARETAYNYSVVVSANAGCNVTAYAPAITFVADPVVEATISNNISCVGGTATLTAVVNGGVANVNGLNGYTFEWYNNVDPTTPVSDMPSFTISGNEGVGNYSYWVTVTSNYGCQSTSAPVTYSVIADPEVTIAVANGYPATVCDGGSTMIKANVTGGYGDIAYQWYKNGNLLVGETNQTLNLASLAYGENDIYTVEVTQTGVGCANNASIALSAIVTVAPTYTVDITGFGNVCEGGTLTLNATVNNVLTGDVLSYQWYRILNGNEAVAISGANTAQYSTSELLLGNSYDYYVVVTSTISGCSVVSNSVPANIVPVPTVTIQGANTVCEGGNLTLNAFVNGGVEGAAYTYTWNWTGAATGTATTAVPTFVPTVSANDAAAPYYFTVTISRNDNTGCTATSEAHEVNVLAVPTVTVTADNNYVCQNGDVTFTAHVSPVGVYNYVWTINGQQQAVNASTITTSIANVGTITAGVVVSAANASASCSATATIATPVQVVAAPTVTISADHTTMCVGGTTTLTSNISVSNNIPGEFNYQWAINGIEVPGAVANTFVQPLDAAGEYVYTLRVSQNNDLGCSSAWSAPVTVQVAEQPVVTLTTEDGLSICEGGSITMKGIVTNYNNTVNGVTNNSIYGALTFDWTSNGVNVHHNTNVNTYQNQVTETFNTVGNYSYQVTVDAAGYNCLPQASNIHVVNVVGDPSWTEVHVYSTNGTDACLGDMVTLAAAIQGGVTDGEGSTSGHIQWVVTDGNGNTMNVSGGLGGFSYDIPAVAGTYTYTPTFLGNIGNGCQLTNTGAVQVAVTVHDLPTATFTSGDSSAICANDPSASAALVIAFTGVAPFTYEVVDGQGNVVAHATTQASTATIYVAPTEQTTYRITLIQDAYCENTAFGADAVATVFVNSIEFENTVFESGCDNPGMVTVNFTMTAGNPNAAFTVIYDNGLQASGNISNNTATFVAPTIPGDYNAVITIDGCSYDIVVRVLVGEFSFGDGTLPIMDQRWNDVVVVNNNPATNGGHIFVGFQWYKNGVAIPGATYSNYQEKGGLNGFYSVELIEQDANGNMVYYKTCEMYFNSVSAVKVYPVPANVRQEITIELDLTSEELDGAVLDIYTVTGALVNHVTDLRPITKIEGFKAQGTYFGRILTGTNEIKTVKFVIVK